MSDNLPDLLHCPCCDAPPQYASGINGLDYQVYVYCCHCSLRTEVHGSHEAASSVWNRRPTRQTEVDRLTAELASVEARWLAIVARNRALTMKDAAELVVRETEELRARLEAADRDRRDGDLRRHYAADLGILDPTDSTPCWDDIVDAARAAGMEAAAKRCDARVDVDLQGREAECCAAAIRSAACPPDERRIARLRETWHTLARRGDCRLRTANVMYNASKPRVVDAAVLTDAQMMRLKNLGRTTWREVREVIEAIGATEAEIAAALVGA